MVRLFATGRSTVVFGVCSLAIALALVAGAAPAGAVVANIGGHGYGITPVNGADEASLVSRYEAQRASGLSAGPLAHRYDVGPQGGTQLFNAEDGPVMHSATTHVIYWDPNKEFTPTTEGIVNGFFGNVAHDSGLPTNVFAVAGQYTDSTGHAAYSSTSSTPLTDTQAYPPSECTGPTSFDPGPYTECMVDEQLQGELSRFISAEKLPVGPTQLYFLLLPHKVATCFEEEVGGEQVCSSNFFCAYHSFIEPGTPNEIIYADIPFSLLDTVGAKGCQDDGHPSNLQTPNGDTGGNNASTRFADVALKYISHEYIEAATDPLVNEETAWVDSHGQEIGDKCNGVDGPANGIGKDPNSFLPTLGGTAAGDNLFNQSINTGSYYLQSEWDNAGKACLMKPIALSAAAFTTSPTSGLVGAPVSFKGVATDAYSGLGFIWKYGDGTEGIGASPSHVYAVPGSYGVTMTPRDELTGSTAAPVIHTLVVNDVPTASFTAFPSPATAGVPVEFDGSASKDEDGAIATYAWNFGDGTSGSGVAPTHTYAPGGYTVTLTVTDSAAQTAMTTRSLTVRGAPTAVTGVASSLGQTSATLNASVTPNGDASECTFEYGTTTSYGSSAPCSPPPGAGTSAVGVSAAIAGLIPDTTYHFRIVAKNSFGPSTGADQTFATPANPVQTSATSPPVVNFPLSFAPPAAPTSAFIAQADSFSAATGAITFKETVADPGTFSWLATFANGKLGAFASASKCKAGSIKLAGKCRPARIVFAKGSEPVAAAGTVSFTLKPSPSAAKALKNALRKSKGLPVSVVLTFRSSRGGSAVSHALSLLVKLKK
jgi:hypothetical protein